MRTEMTTCFIALLVAVLSGCGESAPPAASEALGTSEPVAPIADKAIAATQERDAAPSAPGPAPVPAREPGGGLIAEESGVDGNLAITIRWSATIVTGIPAEGLTTTVYKRIATLDCPITSGDEAAYSYFAAFDNPDGDVMAATGSYQPWWNEECSGTLKIDDSRHADDPTIKGPEPTVHTRGVRPLSTGDTPLTVETDLQRGRTRYMFIAPSTDGFQQEAAPGYSDATLVAASAAPMATLDITLEGPIGGGKHEFAVEGGVVQVDWTFTRHMSN